MSTWVVIAAGLLATVAAARAAEPIVPTEALGEAVMVATAAAECDVRPKAWAETVVAAAREDALRKGPGDATGMVGRVVWVSRQLALSEMRNNRQATCERVTRPGALDPFDDLARARTGRTP